MATKKATQTEPEIVPMLKTVEQMSRLSGIGENKLRELMDRGEIEYIQNGNRRLFVNVNEKVDQCSRKSLPLMTTNSLTRR